MGITHTSACVPEMKVFHDSLSDCCGSELAGLRKTLIQLLHCRALVVLCRRSCCLSHEQLVTT